MMAPESRPPRFATRLLNWLIPDGHYRTPVGDFEEYFHEIQNERGALYARWWYRWQVMRLLPTRLYARTYWAIVMLKNYYRTAVRNLRKQPGFAFINISGLAVGIACFLLISLFVLDELSYDRFWPNGQNIYRVTIDEVTPTSSSTYSLTPQPLARALATDFPEVEAATRLSFFRDYSVRHEDRSFGENRFFRADSNFLQLFDIPLLRGDPATALKEPSSMVITDAVARRIFGEGDPIGQTLELLTSADSGRLYTVTGVVQELPDNSHLRFDLLASWWRTGQERREGTSWLGYSVYTYFALNQNVDPEAFQAKLPAMVAQYAGAQLMDRRGISWEEHTAAGNVYDYSLLPLRDIHLDSHTPWEITPAGNRITVVLFAAVALFILLMACVNYMNLSTARSESRAKEIGMRKALGSGRGQIIVQMFMESTLMTFFAVLTALGIVLLGRPVIARFAGEALNLELLTRPEIWLGLLILALLVGVVAGSYPALFLSRSNPRAILGGGGRKANSAVAFRNGLVVFQFVVSICLIVGALIVERQMAFMLDRDLGFESENALVIENTSILGESQEAFKQQLLDRADVVAASATLTAPGSSFAELFLAPADAPAEEQHNVYVTFADHDFAQALDLELASGRLFEAERSTDSLSVVVNQALVRIMGLTGDPLGQAIKFVGGGNDFPIIGVVQDFNFQSLHSPILPFAYFIDTPPMRRFVVRVRTNRMEESLAGIEEVWNRFASAQPLSYAFLDDNVALMYAAEQRTRKLFRAFSILAIGIACLGLFGLSAFTVERRTKEIGVRKVLGASVTGVVTMLSREFVRLALIAFVIAVPLAWLGADAWLDEFAYHIDIGPFVFIVAGFLTAAIAMLTVSVQSLKAARTNPARALRFE